MSSRLEKSLQRWMGLAALRKLAQGEGPVALGHLPVVIGAPGGIDLSTSAPHLAAPDMARES